jgi:uncharacterized protein (UPF0332 family)
MSDSGGSSVELLVYSSQLRRGDYAEGWGGTPEIERAVQQAVYDRLDMARGFCEFAERLLSLPTPQDMDYRNTVSRAYYACHHAMRACALGHQNGDEPDHRGAITAFAAIVNAEGMLRSKLGEAAGVERRLNQLMEWRHRADYYPYGSSYPLEEPVDFAVIAGEACGLARAIVEAVASFLKWRKGGSP